MMRALAEFIMAGRWRAAAVASLGNLLPLISPAAVGLVTLRQGTAEGLLVALWGALPLLVALSAGEASPVMMWASIAVVAVIWVGAEILRNTASWSLVLTAIVLISAVIALLMGTFLSEPVAAIQNAVTQWLQKFQPADQQGQMTSMASVPFVIGFVAWVVSVSTVASLLVARWWQAMLYNPGGFRQEFHSLRLEPRLATAMLVGVVGSYLLPPEYISWGSLLSLPLLLSGLALVHHMVAVTPLGVHWLVAFYVGLVLVGPLSLVLVGLGFIDSWMDLRSRYSARRGPGRSD